VNNAEYYNHMEHKNSIIHESRVNPSISINDDNADDRNDTIFKGNNYIVPKKNQTSTNLPNLNVSGEQLQLDIKSKKV